MNKTRQRLVFVSFFTVLASDIIDYLSTVDLIPFNPAVFTAVLKFVSLYCLMMYARNIRWGRMIPKRGYQIITTLLFWNIITIARGGLNAEAYYDWRFLGVASFYYFLVPIVSVLGITILQNGKLFGVIIKRVYLFSFLFVPLSVFELLLYVRTTVSVWFFVLMSIYIKNKWGVMILIAAFFALVTGFEIRANFLRVAVALMLFLLYQFRSSIRLFWLKAASFMLFVIPFVFLFLGITDKFNIFQPFDNDEQFILNEGGKESSNLMADTRTLLYVEVFKFVVSDRIILFGGGATAKYKSEIFVMADNLTERHSTEVGFLNTLLYSGVLGVFLYFLVLAYTAYLGLNKSNNYLCKMLAVFLAFRWDLFFIEDITKYDTNYYFLWIAIGMCLSNQFRLLTDQQIKIWISKYVLK